MRHLRGAGASAMRPVTVATTTELPIVLVTDMSPRFSDLECNSKPALLEMETN